MLDEVVNKVNALRGKYIPRIDVILELAKTLPNDAWAKGITIMDNAFEIEGDAVSSTNLIPILENSSLFSGVGLTSPVTKTQSGRENFELKEISKNKEYGTILRTILQIQNKRKDTVGCCPYCSLVYES